MKLCTIAAASTLVCAFLCGNSQAINGIGVYCHWWSPYEINDYGTVFPRGTIVKATIQNNKVVSRDTIFKQIAEYPALSFDGKRVAFFRWGKQVQFSAGYYRYVVGTTTGPNYLSVMNVDGSNVQNLVQVADPGPSTFLKHDHWKEGNAVLDWPAGDWIYYEKPTKTSEIWRINARVPSRNELVCNYGSSDYMRRWDMSMDAKYAATQLENMTVGMVFGGASAFPLVNNSIQQTTRVSAGTGCNMSLSCGGNFIGQYNGGSHEEIFIYKWDHSANRMSNYSSNTIINLQSWTGDTLVMPGYGGADLIRWAANSEKWVMRQIGWCWQSPEYGSNSVAVNWKDKQAINMSHTSRYVRASSCAVNPPPRTPPTDCAEPGDLWIDFGAGNENKWEDENGVLHAEAPIEPVGTISGRVSAAVPSMRVLNGTCLSIAVRGAYGLSIVNAQGEMVLSRQGHGPAIVDVPSLKPGAYLVQARVQGREFNETIMKMH
jgi:hypothetical protein